MKNIDDDGMADFSSFHQEKMNAMALRCAGFFETAALWSIDGLNTLKKQGIENVTHARAVKFVSVLQDQDEKLTAGTGGLTSALIHPKIFEVVKDILKSVEPKTSNKKK